MFCYSPVLSSHRPEQPLFVLPTPVCFTQVWQYIFFFQNFRYLLTDISSKGSFQNKILNSLMTGKRESQCGVQRKRFHICFVRPQEIIYCIYTEISMTFMMFLRENIALGLKIVFFFIHFFCCYKGVSGCSYIDKERKFKLGQKHFLNCAWL